MERLVAGYLDSLCLLGPWNIDSAIMPQDLLHTPRDYTLPGNLSSIVLPFSQRPVGWEQTRP